MNGTVLTLIKAGGLAFYLIALASPVVPSLAAYATMLLAIAALLLVSHVIEYLVVRQRLEGVAPGPLGHFGGTLLFGFLYWMPLLKAAGK